MRETHGGKAKVIGIAGSGPSVGVTHFSILTANYLEGVLRGKTAVAERSGGDAFDCLSRVWSRNGERAEKKVTEQSPQAFNIWEVSYYAGMTRRALLDLLDGGYDYVVIDFGVYREEIWDELLLCDRRFLLGSGSEWQLPAFVELLTERGRRRRRWEYFLSLGNGDNAGILERSLGIPVRRIPRSEDAFAITGEVLLFFEKFLN